MARRFAEHPDAVIETLRLAERLEFDLSRELGYRYPREGELGVDRELAELCRALLVERYESKPAHRQRARDQLEGELRTIRALGLSGFFLLHRDLLELAREVAAEVRGRDSARSVLPPGRGRGSSVSSIVCYLTGLSHIDPVENDLNSSRFLNEEVGKQVGATMPDIDLDFPRDIREVLIPRVHERYGADRSALVAAFPTYRPRGAVRDLGKALGLPGEEIEKVARMVGFHERSGDYAGIADLASRSGTGRGPLNDLARRRAYIRTHVPNIGPSAPPERREALWGVGGAAVGVGDQVALPLEVPQAPELAPLSQWERMIADYRSIGMTLDEHPLALMRADLDPEILRSDGLARLESRETVEVAGLVVARQRPQTVNGIVFMLLEDERGTVNLIVPPPVYERCRAAVRAAPLVRARGKLERHEGTTNVVVSAVIELKRSKAGATESKPERRKGRRSRRPARRRLRERAVAELRAVAPVGHSWGRRG